MKHFFNYLNQRISKQNLLSQQVDLNSQMSHLSEYIFFYEIYIKYFGPF